MFCSAFEHGNGEASLRHVSSLTFCDQPEKQTVGANTIGNCSVSYFWANMDTPLNMYIFHYFAFRNFWIGIKKKWTNGCFSVFLHHAQSFVAEGRWEAHGWIIYKLVQNWLLNNGFKAICNLSELDCYVVFASEPVSSVHRLPFRMPFLNQQSWCEYMYILCLFILRQLWFHFEFWFFFLLIFCM